MAAHLRRNIRLFVGGNHLSPPLSPLSAARPSMGARPRSSSSMASSPDQASKIVIASQGFFAPIFVSGLLYTFCQGIDFGGLRSGYEYRKAETLRNMRSLVEADLAVMQRKIDERKGSQRAPKNGSVAEV